MQDTVILFVAVAAMLAACTPVVVGVARVTAHHGDDVEKVEFNP
jgi:hypothetical protein